MPPGIGLVEGGCATPARKNARPAGPRRPQPGDDARRDSTPTRDLARRDTLARAELLARDGVVQM